MIPVKMYSRCALLALALLAACGAEEDGGAAGGAATDSTIAAAPAQPATTDTTPSAAAPDTSGGGIVLAADGVETGGKRLAFGGSRAAVLADVAGVVGQPEKQSEQEECPAGPLYQAQYRGGLSLVFQDSAFVGWFAEESSALRTAKGVGPGSTLAELKAAYPSATMEETSLGMEFAAEELYGILTDSTAAGKVQVMFAGTNCIFR